MARRSEGLPTSGEALRPFLLKNLDNLAPYSDRVVGGIGDQGIITDYLNHLYTVTIRAQALSSNPGNLDQFRSDFNHVLRYSEYCKSFFTSDLADPHTTKRDRRKMTTVLQALTSIPGAGELDRIAARFEQIVQEEDPFSEAAHNEMFELQFLATRAGFGPERERIEREQHAATPRRRTLPS